MSISGMKLGAYEILSLIGSGGMGEVYSASDPRIGRKVAIKLLPEDFAHNEDRLRRFQQESRSIGMLNHPNILAIYDVGAEKGIPYLVSELLEGETLRKRLTKGALSTKKTIEYANQIAQGLAAAHDKGIIHRDLKPENIFITNEGRVKILDFGLAKLKHPEVSDNNVSLAATLSRQTEMGVVMGTVLYMSPEQVRGEKMDNRSDIFAYGSILYEMVSGKRPFEGNTKVEVMHAILNLEPSELSISNSNSSPGLERIVHRCLEKDPDRRFQSTHDLAFAIESLSGSESKQIPIVPERKRNRILFPAIAVAALAIAAGLYFGKKQLLPRAMIAADKAPYTIQQLSFRRGNVPNARFAPDGQNVIFEATWSGNPREIYFSRIGNPEARSLGLKDARLLSVSSSGEMAVLLRSSTIDQSRLARVSFSGGAPREISYGIQDADWTPDGKNLVVMRRGRTKLEYPIGKVLYESNYFIRGPRFSPDGKYIAFGENRPGGVGDICIVDLSGKKKVLWTGPMNHIGVAWSPSGNEIWFGARSKLSGATLNVVTLSAKHREILTLNGTLLILHEVTKDGRVLFTHGRVTQSMVHRSEKDERDLSWLDQSAIADISDDGKTLLFTELGEFLGVGHGSTHSVYVRRVDESEAVRLGEGTAIQLSPDGKWALSFVNNSLTVLPLGAGSAKKLKTPDLGDGGQACWFPDGKKVLYTAGPRDHWRIYRQNIDDGEPKAVSPEGMYQALHHAISPDGKLAITTDPKNTDVYGIYDLEKKNFRWVGFEPNEEPVRWSADGRSIYVSTTFQAPARIFQLDLATGKRKLWKELRTADPAGVENIWAKLTPDGKTYAYSYTRVLTDLYVLDGL